MSGTDLASAAICLCACYEMPGTNLASATSCLCVNYGMPGTDTAAGTTRLIPRTCNALLSKLLAMSKQVLWSYAPARRSPVLTHVYVVYYRMIYFPAPRYLSVRSTASKSEISSGMALRVCYEISGIDLVYAATRSRAKPIGRTASTGSTGSTPPIKLWTPPINCAMGCLVLVSVGSYRISGFDMRGVL
eukprot:1642579-Rhodomonas_salina.5